MNPDTIGYVWTGEYNLNTLRVDGETEKFLNPERKSRGFESIRIRVDRALDAFEHMRFSATKSFAINCQNVSESTVSGMNTLLPRQRGK